MVTINGLEWKVITESNDYKWFGLTKSGALEIHIARVQSIESIKRSITHEVIHAYLFSYGFPKKKMNEEELCEFIANNLEAITQISQQVFSQIDLEME